MQREQYIALLLAGFALAAQGAEPSPKKTAPASKVAQPDIKFLEYLGTLEGDDENWTEIADSALAAPEGKGKAKAEAVVKSPTETK